MTGADGGLEAVDAIVVGAGFAGLYMIYKLRASGLSVLAFEAAADVGGTWFWNRYPGARCDIESTDYSYSFDPALEQEWTWTERFASQPEILRYLSHVADRHDLRRHIAFSTRVTGSRFDDASGRWTVTTDQGHQAVARFLITAVGCLSTPKPADIAGVDDFEGPTYITGRWPHEGVDFTGQRVGVIGTGSSGIQAVPLIAGEAEHLTVFQRTAAFTVPARNRPIDPVELAAVRRRYREIRSAARRSAFGVVHPRPDRNALEVDEAERLRTYEDAYSSGSLFALTLAYKDLLLDIAANDTVADFIRSKIRTLVRDPLVAERLTPTDYPFATKRPCMDTDYYETFNRPNVELVDLKRTPILTITARGVQTTDAEHPLDSLVLATGFDAVTGSILRLGIVGRSGLRLGEKWTDGPRTYLGLCVAGFPNMFTITGPGSPSVLSNVVVSIEQHVEWIAAIISHARRVGATVVEARAAEEEKWTAHVTEVADATLYPLARSWFLGDNLPGKPRVFMAYAVGVNRYRKVIDGVAAEGFASLEFS